MSPNKPKAIVALCAILFFILGATLLQAGDKDKYEEKFERTETLAKDGKVVLSNVSGDIEVMTWDKNEVKIDALKESKASSLEKAKENAAEVKIEITKEGNVLRIRTDYPKTPFRSLNVSVDFHLTIPSSASADIKSVSGDIHIHQVGGEARAESVSGDVTLEEVGGAARAKSVSGDIQVLKAARGVDGNSVSGDVKIQDVSGDVDLKTVSGDILLERLKGSVETETVSGDIHLLDVSAASVIKASSVSGDVKYFGDFAPGGRCSISSHSGDIEMTIPGNSAFNLEAKTFSGTIDSEFEIVVSGILSRKELRGSVNGGGAEVDLKTFSGDIDLRKK